MKRLARVLALDVAGIVLAFIVINHADRHRDGAR